MKQKLLLILICLWGISNVCAQPFKAPVEMKSEAKTSAIPAKITGQQLRADDGTLYFGYCGDDFVNSVGDGVTIEMSAAICMPASISGLYAGKTISKIRIGLTDNCTNVSVWIRTSLTGPKVVSQTVGNANKGWTEVSLSNPFTIPNSDFYIGYTATGGPYQIGFSGITDQNACWLQDELYIQDWTDYSGRDWGSLCIQAGIDTKGATVLALDQESLQKIVQSSPNQNFFVPCSVKSLSSVDITSVKVSCQINNQTPVERTISTSLAPMKTGSFDIPIDAIASIGIYQLSVKILEINGQPNASANKILNGEIRILSHSFPRRVVMEEGTGTWCGFCPRGAVGMAMMKEKYPDTFIGIAVHNGDPMTIMDYNNFMTSNFINSFPSAVVNRKTDLITDPYPDFGAENAYQSEITKMPIAGIQLTGKFANGNGAITLKTVSTFGVSSNSANFRLAYVLVENGVTGYEQANYYSGSGAMGGYENKPNPVKDMVFDDVARGIYSDPTGIPSSIPTSVTEMAPVEHTYTINLPASIQNKGQLEVVVMLLNTTTGEIENADRIKMSDILSNYLSLEPESMEKVIYGTPNRNFTIPIVARNYSSVGITSVKASYQMDNNAPVEQTIQVSIAPMKSDTIYIPVKAMPSGMYQLSVKIPEINGQPNFFAEKALQGQVILLSQIFPRKVVMEEGTGTWCGWCIRGAVGMAMMKEKYPDTFIGIAVHNSDPMTLMAYDNFMTSNFINSFPSAVINRKKVCDPYPDSGSEDAYQTEIAKRPIAGIKLSGGFTDANKKTISLKTETTFGFSLKSANFKLAYVLIEDGVTGYDQANYYSGGGSGVMGGYENKPNPVTNMVFNDVARGIYSDPTGIPGSIPASVTEMTPVENTYTINLPNSVQNKDQLAVAVMLINSATGEIENADIIGIGIIGQGIPVTGVKLNQTAATLLQGSTLQLTAIFAPVYATNKKVTWSSSNSSVASVDTTGKITALAAGTATITVTTEDGNKTATCEVKVIAAPCDSPIASGTTGDLIWMLCPDGTLTIIGQGAMPDYAWGGGDAPWYSMRSNIRSVDITDNVKSIGANAFSNYNSLTSVTISNSLTTIGQFAFYSCFNLTVINIPQGVETIGEAAFEETGISSIYIPKTVTSIGNWVFTPCYNLTSINVDPLNTAYTSENGILFNKDKTKIITYPMAKATAYYDIPNTVKIIGIASFANCQNLSGLNIPNTVTTIEGYAFASCGSEININIPSSVIAIESGAFNSCGFITINVHADNPAYTSEDGVLFSKNKTLLIQFPGNKAGDYIMPSLVNSISQGAFYNCNHIKSVVVSEHVTTIGDLTFYFCSSLNSVTLPRSIKQINNSFLGGCNEMKTLIVNWASPLSVSANLFSEFNVPTSQITLFVPAGTKALYQNAAVWKDFGSIVEKSATLIPDFTVKTSVYFNDGKLYVDSPVAEKIQIYSTDGTLLNGFQKPAGNANYSVETTNGSVLIVKGSSGWVKKVIYNKSNY